MRDGVSTGRSFDLSDFEKDIRVIDRAVRRAAIGAKIGFVAGAVGGVFLGESINDYVEALSQTSYTIQYAVDALSAVACGLLAAPVVGGIAALFDPYRSSR